MVPGRRWHDSAIDDNGSRHGAIVLAGGRSTRMGQPKAWLDWHGTPLLDRVARTVRRAIEGGPVVVVRAPGQELPPLDASIGIAEDAEEGRGPLAGIAVGLGALPPGVDVAFVCSTDVPLLHPAFVRAVLAAVDGAIDVALPDVRGHRQPLAAAYRSGLLPAVEELLASDRLRPAFLFDRCRVRVLDEAALLADPALRAADPELESVENLNDRAAYEAARALPAPAIAIEVYGALRPAGQRRQQVVRAADLAAAATAAGLDLDAHVVAAVNGDQISRDPRFPLAAGDRVAFMSADAGG
jgi:molybdopterin-guanine dinucleotide biosynthesis protein A